MGQNKLYQTLSPIIYTILAKVQGRNIMNFKDGWERERGEESMEIVDKFS